MHRLFRIIYEVIFLIQLVVVLLIQGDKLCEV